MTITELIAKLECAREKHGDLLCFGSWEGQGRKDITVTVHRSHDDGTLCLLDVDDGMYISKEDEVF